MRSYSALRRTTSRSHGWRVLSEMRPGRSSSAQARRRTHAPELVYLCLFISILIQVSGQIIDIRVMGKGASFVPSSLEFLKATADSVSLRCESAVHWDSKHLTGSTAPHYYAPKIHSEHVTHSLLKNHRPHYRDLGAAFSDLNATRIKKILLSDPYDDGLQREPSPSVCTFNGGYVSPVGILCAKSKAALPSAFTCLTLKACAQHSSQFSSNKILSSDLQTAGRVIRRAGVAISVAQPFYGHFHFIVEIMPRLVLVSKHIRHHKDTMIHLGTAFVSEFMLNTMSFILRADKDQLADHQIISNHVKGMLQFDTLIVPEPVACGSPASLMLLAYKRHVANLVPIMSPDLVAIKNKSLLSAILIHRDGLGQQRRIQNYAALLQGLKAGLRDEPRADLRVFGNAEAGTLTFLDQARLFEESSLVIGAHGAGLVNMLHLRHGSSVVEILPMTQVLTCYMHLAAKLGLRYHSIASMNQKHKLEEGRSTHGHSHKNDGLASLYVDVDEVVKVASEALSEMSSDVDAFNEL